MTLEEREEWENISYRIKEEGFHYCFENYSTWSEIKDEQFHKLRLEYLETAKLLKEYIDFKLDDANYTQ